MVMNIDRKPRAGFTLIELLVVVAIIGMLIALLVPVLSNVKEQARRTSAAGNFKGIGQALSAFAAANAGKIPVSMTNQPDSPNFMVSDPENLFWSQNKRNTNTYTQQQFFRCDSPTNVYSNFGPHSLKSYMTDGARSRAWVSPACIVQQPMTLPENNNPGNYSNSDIPNNIPGGSTDWYAWFVEATNHNGSVKVRMSYMCFAGDKGNNYVPPSSWDLRSPIPASNTPVIRYGTDATLNFGDPGFNAMMNGYRNTGKRDMLEPRQVIMQDMAWKDLDTNKWSANWVSGNSSASMMPSSFTSVGGYQCYLQGYWTTTEEKDLTGINVLFGDMAVEWRPITKTRNVWTPVAMNGDASVPADARRIQFKYGGE